MKLLVYVAGVSKETWFRGQKDERQVTMLNCLDRDSVDGMKFKETFDYQPTAEESEKIDLEKLDGAQLAMAVETIKPGNGGRLKIRGKLDLASVPKTALRVK